MKKVLFTAACLLSLACGDVRVETDAAPTPDAAGSVDASVDLADAAPPDADPSDPDISVSPLAHEFGPVALDSTSATTTFTFTNNGGAAATGCSPPSTSGAHATDFTIVTDNCGTDDLAANGGSCTVLVAAAPTAAGLRTATLLRSCTEGGTESTTANGLAVNRPMRIFISSVSYNGNLGGLPGADALCNTLGTNGTVSGPMNKTWKALLSKTAGGVVNARDRFTWTGPLLDLRGNVVTNDPSSWPWVAGASGVDIGVNESGGGPDDSYVWTGSTVDGLARVAGNDCNNWSDDTGDHDGWAGETGSFPSDSWFDSFSSGCGDQWYGLYCVSE